MNNRNNLQTRDEKLLCIRFYFEHFNASRTTSLPNRSLALLVYYERYKLNGQLMQEFKQIREESSNSTNNNYEFK